MKKIFLGIGAGIAAIAIAAGIYAHNASDSQIAETASDATKNVTLELTYPAGKSPRVFTKGWVFGVRCTARSTNGKIEDISNQVHWDGTGDFKPAVGAQSRPEFQSVGKNTIKLTAIVNNEEVTKEFTVDAVSPDNYAHVGDIADCPSDSHGCPSCPHHVKGPILTGSPNVFVDGKPAARVGDTGTHKDYLCCGPNKFEIVEGDNDVLIDGKAAARIGDKTKHCGGIGAIAEADIKPVSSTYSFDGDWGLTITQHKSNYVTKATKAGLKSSSYSGETPDEKTKRTFRQQTNDVKIGSDIYEIESFTDKSFVLKRTMSANNAITTFEYKGAFDDENSWSGTFTRKNVFEGPGYTTTETETYHIEALRLASYDGNVAKPIQENLAKFGL